MVILILAALSWRFSVQENLPLYSLGTMDKPEKIIMSKHGGGMLLSFGAILLALLIPVLLYISFGAGGSDGLGVLVPLLVVAFMVFALSKFFSSGSDLSQPAMIEISDCVHARSLSGSNEQQYPLEDIAKVSLYKKHFELTLSSGRMFSFSSGDYSVEQLKLFFSRLGMHCQQESECTLIMKRDDMPLD